MITIRKILVKQFVLDYIGNIFCWRYNAVRASRIIYPLVVLSGFFSAINPDWPTPTVFIWVLYSLLFISLYLGFVHFRIWPAKWDELDDLQKFQYGKFNSGKLTGDQLEEWTRIAEKLYDDE